MTAFYSHEQAVHCSFLFLTTLGSRGYFFLIDTDGSRRSRVNEAQRTEEKKNNLLFSGLKLLTRFSRKLMFDKECNPGHKWGSSQKPQQGWCSTLPSIYQWSETATESEMSLKWKCFTPQHGRYLHPLATTDRPMCQQTGFHLLLRDLEIKRNINKLKTCKYTNKWTAEREYGMTKGAFAVLSWSPRSRMVYTIRSVSLKKLRSRSTLRTLAPGGLSRNT